jgi:hypothetical protein
MKLKLKWALSLGAIYMALVGVGHLLAPVAMSAGVVPADASTGLVAFLRHYSAIFIAVAVMDWLVRDAQPSESRNAIVVANLLLFGLAAALDLFAVVGGTGIVGLVPAAINLVMAALFVWARRG